MPGGTVWQTFWRKAEAAYGSRRHLASGPAGSNFLFRPLPQCPATHTSVPSDRSEENTSELQSLMRTSYAVFCLKTNTRSIHLTTYRTNQHQAYRHHSQTIRTSHTITQI